MGAYKITSVLVLITSFQIYEVILSLCSCLRIPCFETIMLNGISLRLSLQLNVTCTIEQ